MVINQVRVSRIVGTALALALWGRAGAENYFQVRYFVPTSGLAGAVVDGSYQARQGNTMYSLNLAELSIDRQNFRASYSSGALSSLVSFDRSWYRQGSTLLGLVNYNAPQRHALNQASLIYLRSEDERPTGYTLDSVTLTVGGALGPSRKDTDWKWTSGATYDHFNLRTQPEDPTQTRTAFLGINGKSGPLNLQSRVQYSLSETRTRGSSQQFMSTWSLGYALTSHEKLNFSGYLGRTTVSTVPEPFWFDSEELQFSTDRVPQWVLAARLTRNNRIPGARLSAEHLLNPALRLSGAYGVTLTAPLSQFAELGVNYQKTPWSIRSGMTVQYTPGPNDTMQLGMMPSLDLTYQTDTLSAQVHGNLTYLPSLETPWTYHLDANLKAVRGRWTWTAAASADSPNNRQPLTVQTSLQAVYQATPHLGWNTSVRYLNDARGQRTQVGLGVKYVF